MKTKVLLWVLVLAGVVGLGAWLLRLVPGQSAAASAEVARPPAPPQSVTAFEVVPRDVPVLLEAAGTVVSLSSVEVRPQMASTVREVRIRDGQMVRAGEVLFVLDDRMDRANLDKARAQLQRDRATLADLQRQLDRARDLRAQAFIAQSAVDAALTQVESQQAAVRASEAAVQASEVSVSYATIRAPQGGRVGAIAARVGSLVQPGGAALVTISQIDPIGISFALPEAQLPGLQGAELKLSTVPTRGTEPQEGRLDFVDSAIDTTTGTIKVRGSWANPKQGLWPGQYVTVKLQLRTLVGALVIPQAAVIQRGAERQVYRVAEDSTAQLVPIKLVQPLRDLVAVEGLKAGDRVVVEGKQNLRPGGAVKVVPAGSGKAASGAVSGAASGAASGASS
jgi:membrane fusion protein, multidrug efflux system